MGSTTATRSVPDSFVLVHRTLQMTGRQLGQAMRGPSAPQHAEALERLWRFYAAGLRDHHQGESQVIFPLVATRDRGFAQLEATMQQEHDDIDTRIEIAGRSV